VTNHERAYALEAKAYRVIEARRGDDANAERIANSDLVAYVMHELTAITAALRSVDPKEAAIKQLMRTCAGLTAADLDAVVAMSETFARKSPAPEAKGE
jgi:hypothetical protein